jgi:uncharacterized protein YutE (UPF0331/DUF86 family)
MAVDRQIIEKLLNSLRGELSKLDAMEFTYEELVNEVDIQDLVNRRMQIAIESCIDIATHLASGLNMPGQNTAADVFRLLAKEDIITDELAEKIAKACGLRNILVHQYLEIDYKIIYQSSREGADDLREFARQVVEFLEKNPQV